MRSGRLELFAVLSLSLFALTFPLSMGYLFLLLKSAVALLVDVSVAIEGAASAVERLGIHDASKPAEQGTMLVCGLSGRLTDKATMGSKIQRTRKITTENENAGADWADDFRGRKKQQHEQSRNTQNSSHLLSRPTRCSTASKSLH
jgi:hypothetical protein